MVSLADISWAAGIFEGEGSIYRVKNGPNTRIEKIVVPQNDRWVLERLQAILGGSIYRPYPSRPKISHWQATGARARGIAYTLFSYLSPRRKGQVLKALEV